jgi:4-alpha-glucanotransferase
VTELVSLNALCAHAGVEPSYVGYDGRTRDVSPDTLRVLLAALGYDASSEARAAETLAELQAGSSGGVLAPVGVLVAGAPGHPRVEVQLGAHEHGDARYWLRLQLEDGRVYESTGHADARPRLTLPLPERAELPFGYHRLRCALDLHGRTVESEQTLIVTPGRCVGVSELVGGRRALGLWTHLYSLRSIEGWGIGDLRDLRALLAWAGSHGLELVGINPLHAIDERAPEVNPYHSLSRSYRSPLYLDVEAVVAAVGSPAAALLLRDPALQVKRAELQQRVHIDYAAVHAIKLPVLRAAHRDFMQRERVQASALGRELERFVAREGEALEQFARFSTIRDRLRKGDPACADFRAWPAELRDSRSSAVAAFAEDERETVELHAFLQFQLEQQLRDCRRQARSAGMAIGIYGDLALGDSPSSADIWAAPERYARGASVGAPPDAYSDTGQGWGLVPLHPLRMRAEGYRGFVGLVRRAFRQMGMLRIDHVMGLCRQFWVPDGATALDGGYVRFPQDDLLGILALESRRARALVVGEDLGVVPAGLREEMAARNVLRSQVLYFERGHDGAFVPPGQYASGAFVSLGTHDLPTLAGYVEGRDLRVRRAAGNLDSDAALARALREREHAVSQLKQALRAAGLLPELPEPPSLEALTDAVHRWLAGAQSRLIGLGLDDLTLEPDALNTPATLLPQAPNWSRRSRMTLEAIALDPRIADLLRQLRAAVWPG